MDMMLYKPPVWTNEERELLIKNGANYTHKDLQIKFFPNKSLGQISSMRKHLRVRRGKVSIWSKEEENVLKNKGRYYTAKEISVRFLKGKNAKQIDRKRRGMGIKRMKFKILRKANVRC